MSTPRITRRKFLKRSGWLGMSGLVGGTLARSARGENAVAPSERLVMAAIGLGGMGKFDLGNFVTHPDVQFVAVCDVDAGRFPQATKIVNDAYGSNDCKTYTHFEDIIARPDIDAVLIATPDHWHTLISIAAAEAGKDMYCEKPISVTIAEGRAVANTMKRLGRVYQSGTQRRSIPCFRYAVDSAREGKLGELHTIHVGLAPGQICPPQPVQPIPEGFDYDRWLGPSPWEPYTQRRCHGSFRWNYDYSGGQLTDIGAHFNDLAQMGNNSEHTGPVHYEGHATFPSTGLFDTPVNYELTATYSDGKRLIMHDTEPRMVRFEGREGWIMVDDSGKLDASQPSLLPDQKIVPQQDYQYMQAHERNFIDAVKTRGDVIAPPEIAHRSTTICHLANICFRLERPIAWDPETERIKDDELANRLLSRGMRSPWRLPA